MKKTTSEIETILTDNSIADAIRNFKVAHPNHDYYEMTNDEVMEKYLFVRDIILEEIKENRFDQFAQQRRVTFLNCLKGINENRSNINHVFIQVDTLFDALLASGILSNRIGRTDFLSERKELNKSKKKYQNLIDSLVESQAKLTFIEAGRADFELALKNAEEKTIKLSSLEEESLSSSVKLNEQYSRFEDQLANTKTVQEEIEEKRLSITTFSNNIEEYKVSIEKLETQLKMLLKMEDQVKILIEQARDALDLGSAVGISAAFSKQYEEANNAKKKNWWVFGAVLFLVLAAGLTIWIVSDVKNSDKLAVVIGRIVAVGITLAGAVFCSRQYIKQKHIAEDYAYKAVLAKSIVAFSDEIAESHVGVYLNKVLTEIHKDPLRERRTTRTTRVFSDKQLEQITEVVKNVTDTVKN